MPNLYIIAGCNGAGKTTASFNALPKMFDCKEFVNADEIARGISPFQPEKVAIQAGKIMLNRIEELLSRKTDFAIETTLTTTTYTKTIERAKASGYQVTLLFFWLNSVEIAIDRVKQRVKEGGHDIPEETIRRRYKRGIDNLLNIFSDICDNYLILDNSEGDSILISRKSGPFVEITNKKLFQQLKTQSNGG